MEADITPGLGSSIHGSKVYRILFWAAIVLGVLDWIVYSNGMSLFQPFRRPETTTAIQVWREFGPEQTDVVFVGDSLTALGFVPTVVDGELRSQGHQLGSYNLAEHGACLLDIAGVVDYLFGVGGHPKWMVLGVARHQMHVRNIARFQLHRSNPPLAYHLFRADPCWQNACTMGAALLRGPQVIAQLPMQLVPNYQHRIADARAAKGFVAGKAPRARNDERAAKLLRHSAAFQPNSTVEAALARIADSARKHQCRLIVINMPMTRPRLNIERECGYSDYLAWLSGLMAAQGVRFEDMNTPRGFHLTAISETPTI